MTSQTAEIQAIIDFLGKEIQKGEATFTPEESVKAFREHQDKLKRCRDAVAPALEASLRGESQPLDMDAIKAKVARNLKEQGIAD